MAPVSRVIRKGPVAVPTGSTAPVLGEGLRGEHGEGGAGQPQGQDRVGLAGGDPHAVGALGLRGEGDAGEGRRSRPGLGRVGEGGGDGGGGDVRAVLEHGLAQGEQPGAVVRAAPGGGERGGGGAVAVEGGQSLGDAEPAEERGVGAVGGEVPGGREGEGDPQPGAVTGAFAGRALAARGGGEAARQERGEQERGEQPGRTGAAGRVRTAGEAHGVTGLWDDGDGGRRSGRGERRGGRRR